MMNGLCVPIKPISSLSTAECTPKAMSYPEIKPVEEKNRPFWSVMIPTMERPHYLEQALRSVLEQKIPPEEMQIEVIENAITSETTQKMVEKLGRGRVAFYRQPGRKSQSEQWNTCIRRAKGRWVHIFHDDDILIPGFYKAYSEFAQKYPQAGLIFCRAITIDEHGKILGLVAPPPDNKTSGIVRNAIEHLLISDYITAPAAMVKREIYERIGGADPSFHYALDWELFMRVAIQGPMVYIHDPYLCYRTHSKTASTNFIRRGLTMDEPFKIFKKYFSYIPPEIKEDIKKAFYKNTSKRSFDMSRGMLKERYYWGAFRHGLWTLYLKPSRKGFIQCAKSLLAFLKLRTPWEAVHSSGKY